MADEKTVTTFGSDLARKVRDYVKQVIRETPDPNNNKWNNRRFTSKHCFAKITGNVVSGSAVFHSWREVRWNKEQKAFEDAPDGREGTTTANYVINIADPSSAFENDTIVFITVGEDPKTGASFWLGGSSGSLPIGQYPGMFWGMVSNNQAAYAYPFAIQTVT